MSMFSHYYTLIVSRLHAVMMVKMLNLWWQARKGSVPKPNLQLRMPLEDWPDRINHYYVWCVIQTIVSTTIMVWSWYDVNEITLQSPSIQSSRHVLAKLHLQTGTLRPESFLKPCLKEFWHLGEFKTCSEEPPLHGFTMQRLPTGRTQKGLTWTNVFFFAFHGEQRFILI